MNNIFKKAVAAGLLLAVTGSFAACGKADTKADATTSLAGVTGSDTQTEAQADVKADVVLKVGANITPHSEILEVAKPLLADKGITLEIVRLEDSVTPNTGVIEGSLDANYFQNGSDLVSVGAVHYEPFGIYAGRVKDLKDIKEGAVIAVPNNVTNEARALLLLDQEGIIKLKEGAGITATVEDIEENPLNISFKELAPEQLVAALPDVDAAVINGNYAIEGGLHVSQALAVEANDGLAAQTYGNIIATSPDKAEDPAVKALVEVLQGPEVAGFIKDTYDGAVVPLFG